MPKSIPQRQCVGCREKKPKPELIRVVRAPDGAISLDARGKAAGRGAYLCPKAVCLKKAQKNTTSSSDSRKTLRTCAASFLPCGGVLRLDAGGKSV